MHQPIRHNFHLRLVDAAVCCRRYTQLRCERAECQAAEGLALAATQASSSGSGKTCKQHAAVHADGQQAGAAAIASSSAGSSRRLALPAGWRQRMRVAASGLLGALIVGSRNGQVGRSLQAASLLFLLHSSRQR